MHDEFVSSAGLSDRELLHRLVLLAGRERKATVELIVHLAEFDARRLYVGEGYGSLFAYCTGPLRLAEHGAYNRIEAARLSRRFPVILDLLSDGSLNLTTLRLLAPHLRPDNFETVVARAKRRSKREVEVLVAHLAPRPDVPATVRKLPEPRQVTIAPETQRQAEPRVPGPERERGAITAPVNSVLTASLTRGSQVPPAQRPIVAPLAAERYRVQFTVGGATHEKLRRAQELLRREIPDGNPAAIFDRALTLLLEDVTRKKLAMTSKLPRSRRAETGSRHVSAIVKRTVWQRDAGQCAFVSVRGRRCARRVFLEFHHREPYAIGGEATLANISLRCRAHNAYEAELAFGGTGNSPRGELREPPGSGP
jgi:hypothetical protein